MSVVRLTCNSWSVKDENRDVLSQIWPELKDNTDRYLSLEDVLIEIDDLPSEIFASDGVKIKPVRKVRFENFNAPNLNDIKDIGAVKEFVKTVNQIVMPGYELLGYGQIIVLDDCCTDVVQSHLDDGWRIIAVMPQPDSRRPDYILVRKGVRKDD